MAPRFTGGCVLYQGQEVTQNIAEYPGPVTRGVRRERKLGRTEAPAAYLPESGMSSSSMKWMTPLVARTSLLEMTAFPLIVSMSPLQPTSRVVPSRVSMDSPETMASAHMADFKMWLFSRSAAGQDTELELAVAYLPGPGVCPQLRILLEYQRVPNLIPC